MPANKRQVDGAWNSTSQFRENFWLNLSNAISSLGLISNLKPNKKTCRKLVLFLENHLDRIPVFQVKPWTALQTTIQNDIDGSPPAQYTGYFTCRATTVCTEIVRTSNQTRTFNMIYSALSVNDIRHSGLTCPPERPDIRNLERKSWPPPLSLDRATALFHLVKYLGEKIRNTIVQANKKQV